MNNLMYNVIDENITLKLREKLQKFCVERLSYKFYITKIWITREGGNDGIEPMEHLQYELQQLLAVRVQGGLRGTKRIDWVVQINSKIKQ